MSQWDVIRYLTDRTLTHKEAWGLRLGYTRADARRQMAAGYNGDALAIGCAWRLLGDVQPPMGWTKIINQQISAADRDELVRQFRLSVMTFLEWGIGRIMNADAHYQGLGRLHEALCTIIHDQWGLAFFIPMYQTVDAEAVEPYTGKLGKFGKKPIAPPAIRQEPDWITFSNQEVGRALDLRAAGRHGMDPWDQAAFEHVKSSLAPLAYAKLIAIVERYAPASPPLPTPAVSSATPMSDEELEARLKALME